MAAKKIVSHAEKQMPKRKQAGVSPGTLIYTGHHKAEKVFVYSIQYNETEFNEEYIDKNTLDGITIPENKITWINITGLHEVKVIEDAGKKFNLHTLILEDILNVYQIPKLDDYEDDGVLFITLNEFTVSLNKTDLITDQISLICGKNFVLTFQEAEGDVFEPVRDRIRTSKGRIRKKGSDYLCYALMDALVDSYYSILDKYSEDLIHIEDEIISNTHVNQLPSIHKLNKNLIYMRKSTAPLKEVIFKLMRDETSLIKPGTQLFLRDLHDHLAQILSSVDVDREYLNDLVNTNLTNLNGRLNQVMKVLTLISTIFIPLTFIVGVYGMNFRNMPELYTKNGYFILWGIMLTIVIIQIIIYKKKKWF